MSSRAVARLLWRLVALALLHTAGVAYAEPASVDPLALATRLAELGPRVPGSSAHLEARRLLAASLRSMGFSSVQTVSVENTGLVNIEAVRRGRSDSEIVLAAHYDSVAGSPGAVDNASGCAVILAAASRLVQTPLENDLRIILFDGEESGLVGSRWWVESLDAAGRDRILAAVHLDMVGFVGGEANVLNLAARHPESHTVRTPGWLVHAIRRAGQSVGLRPDVGGPRFSLPVQMVLRTVRTAYRADSDSFLRADIPAAILSDSSLLRPYRDHHSAGDTAERLDRERLEKWVDLVGATVRRLDRLGGRPIWEDEYLVAGRVWLRRDLLWVGFLLWVVLVIRSRPGRWLGADRSARARRGRDYLPGFLFRWSYLAVALWVPAVGCLLTFPLAPLSMWRPASATARSVLQALAFLPWLVWGFLIAVLQVRGVFEAWDLSLAKTLLLVTTLATFSWLAWSRGAPTRGARGGSLEDPAGPVR